MLSCVDSRGDGVNPRDSLIEEDENVAAVAEEVQEAMVNQRIQEACERVGKGVTAWRAEAKRKDEEIARLRAALDQSEAEHASTVRALEATYRAYTRATEQLATLREALDRGDWRRIDEVLRC